MFDTSTNFALPNAIDQLLELFKGIEKFGPKQRYGFILQISIDGYEEMNDAGRGNGVTKRLLDNFQKLLNLPYNKEKIDLIVNLKPTLSKETFCYLDNQEKCNKWFEFFNNEMYIPWEQAGKPFSFSLSLFNCATPTEWTQEDGKEFAKICEYLSQIDLKSLKGWKNYFSAIPMANRIIETKLNNEDFSKPQCGGSCGSYTHNIVPIPGGKYTVCHRGIFDNYVDYCNNTNSKEYMNGLSKSYYAAKDRTKWILNLEDFKNMNHTLSKIMTCQHQIIYTDYLLFLKKYAQAGIIESKYIDLKESEKTLPYYLGTSYCMQDGFIQNGSWTTIATYELPLMYNGAMEIAIQAVDKYFKEILNK